MLESGTSYQLSSNFYEYKLPARDPKALVVRYACSGDSRIIISDKKLWYELLYHHLGLTPQNPLSEFHSFSHNQID